MSSDIMELASSAIRSTIIAPPGKKLVVCDLANIEGRKAAWLAGEDWKLQAFRDYDTILGYDAKGEPIRKGPDLYVKAYAEAFKVVVEEVTKSQRQIGKVMELMLQYEGGVGAFLTGAATYRIDLDEMTRLAWPAIPEEIKAEARGFLEWMIKKKRSTFGLSDETFMCCDALKRLWRRAHPAISSYWKELRDAWKLVCETPGQWFDVRRVSFRVDGLWLKIKLPSGRLLCYPSPRVGGDGTLSYMGINQYSRKWQRIKTYGGKLLENITQASSRDVLAFGMVHAEGVGFEVILTVHDELVTEAPDRPEFSIDWLREIMSDSPGWALDLPLAAAGFECSRYRKGD
jgi:DNA polymerase